MREVLYEVMVFPSAKGTIFFIVVVVKKTDQAVTMNTEIKKCWNEIELAIKRTHTVTSY